MIGVEIVGVDRNPDPVETASIVNGLRNRGVLINSCGSAQKRPKIRPPLIFTQENADMLLDAFQAVMDESA